MDVLVAGEGGELLDPRLHVVAGDPLAGGDRVEVDLVDDRLVGLDHAVGHVDAEVALRLEHGDPELPLERRSCARATRSRRARRRRSGVARTLGTVTGRLSHRSRRLAAPSTTPSGSAAMSRRYWAPSKLIEADAVVGTGSRPRRRRPHGASRRARGRPRSTRPAGVDEPCRRGSRRHRPPRSASSSRRSTSPVRGRPRDSRRRHHDRHRGTVAPTQRLDLVEAPRRRGLQQLAERRVEQRQQRLGLRVAEAGVELDDPWCRREVSASPAYSSPTNGVPRRAISSTVGWTHLREHVVDEVGRRPRQRRVGAHAAGVGAAVAVEEPLEVLRRLQRRTPSSRRRSANSETSGPSRYSSITTRSQAAAWASASSRSSVTTTPLPAASPSSLTTYGGPNSSSAVRRLRRRRCTSASRAVGTPAAAMTSLAKAFDPSSWAAAPDGPKQAIPAAAYGVGDAGDQRRLRADDDQVDAEPMRPASATASPVHRVDRVQRARPRRCPGCRAPRAPRSTAGIAGQRQGQGVLAAAGADHEDLHVAILQGGALGQDDGLLAPGSDADAEICAPDISSSAST